MASLVCVTLLFVLPCSIPQIVDTKHYCLLWLCNLLSRLCLHKLKLPAFKLRLYGSQSNTCLFYQPNMCLVKNIHIMCCERVSASYYTSSVPVVGEVSYWRLSIFFQNLIHFMIKYMRATAKLVLQSCNYCRINEAKIVCVTKHVTTIILTRCEHCESPRETKTDTDRPGKLVWTSSCASTTHLMRTE
jgi:hypothetical protein